MNIYDFGGGLLSDTAKATMESLKGLPHCNGREIRAAPSIDMWSAGVLAFELLRSDGVEGAGSLFGSKFEVLHSMDVLFALRVFKVMFVALTLIVSFFPTLLCAAARGICVQPASKQSFTILLPPGKRLLPQLSCCLFTLYRTHTCVRCWMQL
jgi:hypothetical protein